MIRFVVCTINKLHLVSIYLQKSAGFLVCLAISGAHSHMWSKWCIVMQAGETHHGCYTHS